jgi:hypothetical protein
MSRFPAVQNKPNRSQFAQSPAPAVGATRFTALRARETSGRQGRVPGETSADRCAPAAATRTSAEPGACRSTWIIPKLHC